MERIREDAKYVISWQGQEVYYRSALLVITGDGTPGWKVDHASMPGILAPTFIQSLNTSAFSCAAWILFPPYLNQNSVVKLEHCNHDVVLNILLVIVGNSNI